MVNQEKDKQVINLKLLREALLCALSNIEAHADGVSSENEMADHILGHLIDAQYILCTPGLTEEDYIPTAFKS